MRMRYLCLVLLAFAATGCNTITFTKTEVTATSTNTVTVHSARVFWATESYQAELRPDGGSISATKSTVDSVALGAVAEGVARGMASSAKP